MADATYKQEFLEAHNSYREQHGSPALVYNEDLCSSAQKWADHLLSINSPDHSDTDDGENVYYSFNSVKSTPKGNTAVDSWYSEIKDYNFVTSGPKIGEVDLEN